MESQQQPASPFGEVYSGRIMRAVVDALDIDGEELHNRTARRFYAGKSVSEYSRSEFFAAFGQALIERGFAPDSVDAPPEDADMATAVGMAVALAGERWDHLMANIQSRGAPIVELGEAGERFLRLVAADLALRLFALSRLTGWEPPERGVPLWSRDNGAGQILRRHARRAGLSRDRLALALNVSEASVDNWLDGKNLPTREHVSDLARVLASSGGGDAASFARDLRRDLTFARLADMLAPWIGRDAVASLWDALIRFARTLAAFFTDSPSTVDASASQANSRLLLLGCLEESARPLLWLLSNLERDEGWKKDLTAASFPWEYHFEGVAMEHSERSAAGLAQDYSDVAPEGSDPSYPIARNEMRAHYKSAALDSLGISGVRDFLMGGLDVRRSLARRFPDSAQVHVDLGSYLGMVGKNLGERRFIDKGILECKIAAGLQPDWDNPAVEVGVILMNVGDYDGALSELEKARETLPRETPHLRFAMGYPLMQLGRFAEALEHFEAVIAVRPDYASAYSHAARCAFKLGDKRKGASYAKSARMLGEPGEFTAWREGRYK